MEQHGSSMEDMIKGLRADMSSIQRSRHGGQNLSQEQEDDRWRLKVVRMTLSCLVIFRRLSHQRLTSILTVS